MKKRIFIILSLCVLIFLVGCNSKVAKEEELKIKEVIDLVLSYPPNYDENVSKYITEKNFDVCNYSKFYSLYIGDNKIEEYESVVRNIEVDNEKYIVSMVLNMKAKALEVHGEGNDSEEAIGEEVPVDIVLKKKDDSYYIESFTEYESLEKASEYNKSFK